LPDAVSTRELPCEEYVTWVAVLVVAFQPSDGKPSDTGLTTGRPGAAMEPLRRNAASAVDGSCEDGLSDFPGRTNVC